MKLHERISPISIVEGRKPMPVGTERIRDGKKYVKNAQGGWDYVKSGTSTVQHLQKKVDDISTQQAGLKDKLAARMAEIAAKYDARLAAIDAKYKKAE